MWCPTSADRLSDFMVSVSNVSFPVTAAQLVPPAFTRCGQYQGYPGPGQTGTVTCSSGANRGRYVFISLPTPGVLTMCETWVYAGGSTTNHNVHQHRFQAQCQYKTNTSGISFTDIVYRIPETLKISVFGRMYLLVHPTNGLAILIT